MTAITIPADCGHEAALFENAALDLGNEKKTVIAAVAPLG
jgi:hypothetical protein